MGGAKSYAGSISALSATMGLFPEFTNIGRTGAASSGCVLGLLNSDGELDMATVPPDFRDFPSLQQLARALYHNGSVRGAALFVGAGFSKNATKVTPDTPDPPTWWELLEELKEQLYPGNTRAAPNDPLRLAEEFRCYFGQATLDGFIRTRFPDRAWLPGPLHQQLLSFPWSEVLTTNWDTLLERAADAEMEFVHDIVRTEADLAHARSKRIVKLHGTLGDKDPLIFAAEDYRTYPVRHAAFVNLARQIFIENDLCLIGFSGTDPNFLEWAGWVRDNLGGNARRIYLVGCFNLSSSARNYLQAHNIAPIDLEPLVAGLPPHERHAAATQMFFDTLRAERPSAPEEWVQNPFQSYPLRQAGPDLHDRARKDDAFAADALEKTVKLIQEDRKKYPGWLVCPKSERRSVNYAAFDEFSLLRPPVLVRFAVRRRAEILDEFLWRYTTSFEVLSKNLHDALVAIMALPVSELDRDFRLKFAIALMRYSRANSDRHEFDKYGSIVDAEAPADAPEHIEAQYQRCLFLRDEYDFAALTRTIPSVASDDPLWKMRKAGLYAEVGEHDRTTMLIKEAVVDLEKSYRLNRNSIWIKSALAWASWLHRVSDMASFRRHTELPRARSFKELNIDPHAELDALQDGADEIRRKEQDEQVEASPLFDPGSYRPGKIKMVATPDEPAFGLLYELDQLTEVVGIPMRLNHVQIAAAPALSIMRVTYNHSAEWYAWLLRALHAHLDNPFVRYFGRVAVAQLPDEVAATIRKRLGAAITFWTDACKRVAVTDSRNDRSIATDQLRLALHAQSHMTVRMTVDEAISAFHLGVSLAQDRDILHWWLIEAAGELAKYALQAIPNGRMGPLVLKAIQFPLAVERGSPMPVWPDLTRLIGDAEPVRDFGDSSWDHRIKQLLGAAQPGQQGRPEASERLAYLYTKGVLKLDEAEAFAAALWAEVDDGAEPLPAKAHILESMFARLPAPPGIDAEARVRARVVGRPLPSVMNLAGTHDTRLTTDQQNQLVSLYNFGPLGLPILPDDAARLFDQIVAWVPSTSRSSDPFGGSIVQHFNYQISITASDTLTFAITPAMRAEDRNQARLTRLLDFITRTQSWRAVAALPIFVATVPTLVNGITLAIHRGLAAPDHVQVSGAACALGRWGDLVNRGVLQSMPRKLIEQLLAMIETRQENLHILLDAAEALIKLRMFTTADMDRLMHALAGVREETRYAAIPLDGRRAVTVSLIRKECVRIAILLQSRIADDGTLEGWIEDGRTDALPEVRFAAATAAG